MSRNNSAASTASIPTSTIAASSLTMPKIDPQRPGEIMKCYAPEQLPVITTLAREFAVCDHWFSSLPGPTWPNRFFIHAATSGGLDHSPTTENIASSILVNGYKFDNGTIFDRLDDEGVSWTIYKGDAFPQSLAISGMTLRLAEGRFQDFSNFAEHLQNPGYAASYTFIEPDYHVMSDFVGGNSQHPRDDITRGEALLKQVYEAIRRSPHWENSVLIVTYDEHGGFYDHVPPPQTVAPGDTPTDPENNRYAFDFTQLGVRVPAVIVSPLIPRGTIDHTIYDHTSVLATLEQIFGVLPLTERDKRANTFYHLFSRPQPRTDAPLALPAPAQSGIVRQDEPEESIAARQAAEHAGETAPAPRCRHSCMSPTYAIGRRPLPLRKSSAASAFAMRTQAPRPGVTCLRCARRSSLVETIRKLLLLSL